MIRRVKRGSGTYPLAERPMRPTFFGGGAIFVLNFLLLFGDGGEKATRSEG